MNDCKKSKSSPRRSVLEGTPRVHYDQLEYIEGNIYPDDGEYHHEGTPFTGVAWTEYRGCLSEDSMKDGRRHGRCVSFHCNGEFASDGCYEDDVRSGDYVKWYNTGVMKFHGVFDASTYANIKSDYNEAGVLVREIDDRDHDKHRLRHWTDDGELVYESIEGISTCYAPGGQWAIREHDHGPPEKRNPPEYRDELLYDHASSMIADGLAKYSILPWLHLKLAQNEPRAITVLTELVEHSDIEIVTLALEILEDKPYKEAIPAVERMTRSKRRKDPNAGGFTSPISELAKLVLVNLTVDDEHERKVARGRVRCLSKIREREERERKHAFEEKRRHVMRKWPQVRAEFENTLVGEMTLKSGDQLFTDQVKERNTKYWHYYRYSIDGRTYSACVSTSDPQSEKAIVVCYRAKNPAEYLVIE